jgi:hypothetical protein
MPFISFSCGYRTAKSEKQKSNLEERNKNQKEEEEAQI